MPHAVWKGKIQFGPVNVPVKLYSAVADTKVHSHLLHDQDKVRLQQKMVCSQDGKIVDDEEKVKGYEIAKGEFVVFEPEELDFLEPQASRQIELIEFVDSEQIDERYLDRTYYLGPDGDDQLYVNFFEGLKKTKQAGICQWVMRKKSYLGVLRFENGIIILTTHRYADEVVSDDSFKLDEVSISEKETRIAKNLITELEEKFEPEKYHDEYQLKLQKLIDEKAEGKEVELPALEKVEETEDNKLLEMLEKSLETIKR